MPSSSFRWSKGQRLWWWWWSWSISALRRLFGSQVNRRRRRRLTPHNLHLLRTPLGWLFVPWLGIRRLVCTPRRSLLRCVIVICFTHNKTLEISLSQYIHTYTRTAPREICVYVTRYTFCTATGNSGWSIIREEIISGLPEAAFLRSSAYICVALRRNYSTKPPRVYIIMYIWVALYVFVFMCIFGFMLPVAASVEHRGLGACWVAIERIACEDLWRHTTWEASSDRYCFWASSVVIYRKRF